LPPSPRADRGPSEDDPGPSQGDYYGPSEIGSDPSQGEPRTDESEPRTDEGEPWTDGSEPAAGEPEPPAGEGGLDHLIVVLVEPQDLVNIALVVRAMKNMGLSRLRLVRPVEFNAYRIEGIAHDTDELIAATRILDTVEEAIAGTIRTVGTSARRRSSKQVWRTPADAAAVVLELTRFGDVALVFGPEHRGLSNEQLDRCDEVVSIPTDPSHSSLNLAHAVLLVCYELRKAMLEHGLARAPDLRQKLRHRLPPATSNQMTTLFDAWREALTNVGFFTEADEPAKMRSFRSILRRAGLDQREVRFMTAVAHEFLHYERRLRIRLQEESE
jgi:TrmH family RNA methyltransferase